MKPFRVIRAACLVAACVISVSAQVPSSLFPRFTVKLGKVDGDGLPQSGASLCLLEDKSICYRMPSHTTSPPGVVTYEFGLEPESERLQLTTGGSWVFFSGTFSGGGRGTLDRLAILRYEPAAGGGKIVNLMPFVGVTNSSDRAMWKLPEISPYPVLVLADFIWGENETHFSRHYYSIEAWTFSQKDDKYVNVLTYRTSKIYASLDEADKVRVLVPEKPEIVSRLTALHTH